MLNFPDPMQRAPRAGLGSMLASEWLLPVPPSLQGAVVAVICRDTRVFNLNDAQRLSHLPARELFSLSWFQHQDQVYFQFTTGENHWQQLPSQVVLLGSQMRPSVTWSPTNGRSGMIVFSADSIRDLFSIELTYLNEKILDAKHALAATWHPMIDALQTAQTNEDTLTVLQKYLVPRWQSIQANGSVANSIRNQGRYWVERLGIQAKRWRVFQSERQVERRIKAMSGRSLRQWQSLVKLEGALYQARDALDLNQQIDWAAIACDQGFSDQAHFCRVVKAMTAFSPTDLIKRYAQDESFWAYRLWV